MNLHVHISDAVALRRDPTKCLDYRRRYRTAVNVAVSQWKTMLRQLLGDDLLEIGRGPARMSPVPGDKLTRFVTSARSIGKTTVGKMGVEIMKSVLGAYSRGVSTAEKEVGHSTKSIKKSHASLYVAQLENEISLVLEATLAAMSKSVTHAIQLEESSTLIYRRVLEVLRKTAIKRLYSAGETSITAAYNGGKLDAYEELGVEKIGILAESAVARKVQDAALQLVVETAGDEKVCKVCEGLEGRVYSVKKARPILPAHPNCRCSFVLYREGEGKLFS